jgi:hypothetical protein
MTLDVSGHYQRPDLLGRPPEPLPKAGRAPKPPRTEPRALLPTRC